MVDVTVVVAGEAGQGVRSASETLARLFSRSGYHVFAYPDVMSRIRGGHNFTRIRVSEEPISAISGKINVLLALDDFSVEEHKREMVKGGVILKEGQSPRVRASDIAQVVTLPMQEIAKQQGADRVAAGAVALGAMCALVGFDTAQLEEILSNQLSRKGSETVKQNRRCVRAGFKVIREQVSPDCPCRIPPKGHPVPRILLTGNQAVAVGALSAGIRFYAGYPMSPSTGIMEFLARRQKEFGLVLEQAEDEIGAINMVLGASYAGARVMTATSGGGFSLMVEALGYSGMAELPIVIILCQRPGPATGFPTRTEQAELLFVINASQDEFPRFVFAPGNASQAASCTRRAFELAERFQAPAIVLSDQTIADSLWTVDELDIRPLLRRDDRATEPEPYSYLRYQVTEGGVSPILTPGTRHQLVCSIGSEHDERGL
ncbi:MAG: 2-oxoacid:acceptor oxidoreductase subunit alpha, partial [candidate division WOR-3 bacterium]